MIDKYILLCVYWFIDKSCKTSVHVRVIARSFVFPVG